MVSLPVVSATDEIEAFGKLGYEIDHQAGSHIILRNTYRSYRRFTVPNHRVTCEGYFESVNPAGWNYS